MRMGMVEDPDESGFLFLEAAFLSFKKTADVVPVPCGGKGGQGCQKSEEGSGERESGGDAGKAPERNEGRERNISLQFQQGKPDDTSRRGKKKRERRVEKKHDAVGGCDTLSSPETEPQREIVTADTGKTGESNGP